MNNTTGRILIAGTASGCGKTSVVCALLRAFQKRGLSLAACKCGPDYIDPLFHERILGIPSENLDLFFHTPKVQRRLFQKHGEGKDLVVAEGVMGYYDGLRCSDPEGSTSEIAAALNLPSSLSFLAGEWDIRYCPFEGVSGLPREPGRFGRWSSMG